MKKSEFIKEFETQLSNSKAIDTLKELLNQSLKSAKLAIDKDVDLNRDNTPKVFREFVSLLNKNKDAATNLENEEALSVIKKIAIQAINDKGVSNLNYEIERVSLSQSQQGKVSEQKSESKTNPRIPFTSDHTYQSYQVAVKDASTAKELYSLAGMTLNTMNRCESEITNGKGYKNNPWNITENPEEFLARRREQVNEILGMIKKGGDSLAFMTLQEADFMTKPDPWTDDKKINEDLSEIQTKFAEGLKSLGWGMTVAQNEIKTKIKALVTLHNENILKLDTKSAVSALGGLGFSTDFTDQKGNSVTVVNVHLDFGKDYTQEIEQFQKKQTEADKMTIIIGDWNHVPGNGVSTQFAISSNATNLTGDKSGKISLEQLFPFFNDSKAEFDKILATSALDGVAASPPSKDTVMTISLLDGEVFKLDKDNNIVKSHITGNEYGNLATVTSSKGEGCKPPIDKNISDQQAECSRKSVVKSEEKKHDDTSNKTNTSQTILNKESALEMQGRIKSAVVELRGNDIPGKNEAPENQSQTPGPTK